MSEMKITTIDELKNIGDIIEIPINGTVIKAHVRKPDIICMIVDNKIPNPLLETAISMTESGRVNLHKDDNENETDYEKVKKWIEFLRIIAKECLVSPTFEEIENSGIVLGSQQLMHIYSYVISEVENLKSFRSE